MKSFNDFQVFLSVTFKVNSFLFTPIFAPLDLALLTHFLSVCVCIGKFVPFTMVQMQINSIV